MIIFVIYYVLLISYDIVYIKTYRIVYVDKTTIFTKMKFRIPSFTSSSKICVDKTYKYSVKRRPHTNPSSTRISISVPNHQRQGTWRRFFVSREEEERIT